jgi:uncharacterized protein YfaS (alpha-2-macroglobulin family)
MLFLSKLKTAALVAASVAVIGTASAVSWQKVNEAREKGLPKTAIAALNPIYTNALQNKKYAEAIRALATKIALEGQIEGDKAEEKIIRIQAELDKAPAEMKPMLEAILAHWFWQYFRENRWRFMERTRTAAAPGADFTTWDLPRILAEIDRHFTAALANEKQLKAAPISDYDDLLEKGTIPDAYRPTVFDFLANEALLFYQAGEQGAAKAEDEFEVAAGGPIFESAEKFLDWQPAAADTNSPKFKAIRLFQNLLAFHQKDADRSAFLDLDLARLVFGKNQAVGPETSARYQEALKRFAAGNAAHPLSALALAHLADALKTEDKPFEAFKIAGEGVKKFPESAGGVACYNLIQDLQAKSASIQAEKVWNAPWPTIAVTYRNLDKIFFHAIAGKFEDYLKLQGSDSDNKFKKSLLNRAAAKTWSADLPPTSDLRKRTENVPVPPDLKPGFYIIVADTNAVLRPVKDELPNCAAVWVSDLALIARRGLSNTLDGFVLDANSGAPVPGAEVTIYNRYKNDRYFKGATDKTDTNGLFRFDVLKVPDQNFTYFFLAEHGGQQLASAPSYYYERHEAEQPDHKTVFFTDRAIYRPGQTIYYKGIHFRFDHNKDKYGTVAGEEVVVEFLDPNGKEIARATRKCNDFGSFDGAFTAPRDRLMGRMTIRHRNKGENTDKGSASFSVEEYKRPKFKVELERPKEAAKLGAEVVLTGKATAYTGAAIGGAKVKWRVERDIRFPDWCWWGWSCFPHNLRDSQNIAHGTAITAADGSFTIKFTAAPDLAAPEKNEPVFAFAVSADVTDSTGETRSDSRSVLAGYTALRAELHAAEWQTPDKPVEWNIATTSLDGEPQSAKGTLKVHALKQPARVARENLFDRVDRFDPSDRTDQSDPSARGEPTPDPAKPDSWETGELVAEQPFQTEATGETKLKIPLKAGIYRALLETADRFGKKVTARQTLQVVDPKAAKYPVRLANHFAAPKWSVEPGEKFVALWGTGYDAGRAYVELLRHGRLLRSWWTGADRTQELIEQAVTEEMRGGFTLRVTYVRENRAYFNAQTVAVPWSNKELTVKWEHFTSKLAPGKKETWTAVVSGPNAAPAVAEMVAGMFDASLDQYQQHYWVSSFEAFFRSEYDWNEARFANDASTVNSVWSRGTHKILDWRYRGFPGELDVDWDGRNTITTINCRLCPPCAGEPMPAFLSIRKSKEFGVAGGYVALEGEIGGGGTRPPFGPGQAPKPDLSKVAARKNLNETAFFFPHLLSDSNGVVKMEFTMPEALTEWRFLGFAHDKELRSGFLTNKAVTAKDLMVEPNPPRFAREGDTLEFTVKVSNRSEVRQAGRVKLTFADARTLKAMDAELANKELEQEFDLPPKEARSFAWRLSVPDGMEFLTYKAVGATDRLSDGEEGFLPVLSRRTLVTESLPLPIRGAQTKTFDFAKLRESGKSATLKSQSLTVQMVSQPAWYAVLALPYLMEYPYECSEQVFNRLYANSLARHIANRDPKIRRIFDLWKNTPALDSPLAKNQDLKALLLEETPWLREADAESQARRNVGLLFDANRLATETKQTFAKLADMQLDSGLWPWFPGGRGDEYITLYIAAGFGRLRQLGAENVDVSAALKALGALDDWLERRHREILKGPHPDDYVPGYFDCFYLYGRSFFLKDSPIEAKHKPAVDFFLKQARKFWVKVDSRQSQGHLAIALKRFGDAETPLAIMKSLKERSVSNEEMGMFWRDTELSWWWFRAPIETQALMIEAFDEVAGDAQAVEDCKVWLLKQKQTRDWKTTKATADAVYGLLRRGQNLLAGDALVEVSLGDTAIQPEKVEAGTGFYEQKFVRGEIKPELGKITVKKTDAGVSWGGVHWQYLEDVAKVTPHAGTPLKLKKTLYRKETTKQGPVLKPAAGALAVGDELVVRIELRTDRDMEYVHLKDQRGSGTEPVNVLSQAKYQDGLAYYESTRDTASHFFIHYLPKGVYVFEYSVRVQLKGKYQTGLAGIECMYAPEFNSHSESFELEVK